MLAGFTSARRIHVSGARANRTAKEAVQREQSSEHDLERPRIDFLSASDRKPHARFRGSEIPFIVAVQAGIMTIDYAALDRGQGIDYWAYDPVLRREVNRVLPEADRETSIDRLQSLAADVGTTIAKNADLLDHHDPILHAHDRNGEVINEVEYHPAQHENERLAYGSGAVADIFHPPEGRKEPLPLTHNLAAGYLLGMVDIGLGCPVSMTGAAALVLDVHADGSDGPYAEFFEGLTAADPEAVMEGAMFLTEKQGGSDVGANETTAEHLRGRTYRLTGEKWFCSNVDAGVALVLARRPDAPEGTGGLSLFLVPRTTREGNLNDFVVRRLKDKLGTRTVPTGEIEFHGAEAHLIGEPERGFKYMSTMLNMERLHNAMASVGVLSRAALETKIHAENREAFGSPLAEKPLMRRDLVDLTVAHETAAAFTFDAARAFDRAYRNDDDETYRLMRLLVPVAKYRTARMAVDSASYAMEILGGNGYVREWVTHRLLRDAQVLPIWEGPSNVMALDVLRAMVSEAAHEPTIERVETYLGETEGHPPLADLAATVREELAGLEESLATLVSSEEEYAQLQAKTVADYVFDVYTAALLLAEAARDLDAGDARKALVARRFVDEQLRDRDARGITEETRLPLEQFDALVRFDSVDPAELKR